MLWRLLPDVRPAERSRFLFFAGLLGLVSAAQTLGLAGSEALFLAQIGVAGLDRAFIAGSLFTVFGSMVYALHVGASRNDLLFLQMLLGSGVLLASSAVGVVAGVDQVVIAVFCFWYLAQAVFLNHFWTFSGDYFDAPTFKRLVPYFTVGSSLGGVFGGLVALALARLASPVALVIGWGVALVAAAALLWVSRRALRRWGPLELEEADETSVTSLQASVRYLRTSPLAQWLAVSCIGMVLAFFLAQYLYSDVFARRFPDPSDLAAFFGLYLAVTNGIEIAVEVAVAPWLIRRFGVAAVNLVHPVLMLLSFGGLAWRYAMPTAVSARLGRELMDNALAQPVRALMQNAMPARFRGRMRAFLEGIVVHAGMAAAGVVLLLLGDPEPRMLCAVGAAASLFYFAANWRARRAYLHALVSQLQAGRIDLADVAGAIGTWEASRLAALWEDALREDGRHPSPAVLQLIPALAARGIVDPLVRAASHPSAELRRASLTALASVGGSAVAGPLALSLDDPDPGVRLAALRGLVRGPGDRGFLAARIRELLEDSDPRVRAEAARELGPEGEDVLRKLIGSTRPDEAVAALAVAPPSLLEAVVGRFAAPDPRVRAAALEAAARVALEPPLAVEEVVARLRDPEPAIRRAAVLLATNLDDDAVQAAVVERLADASPEVQFAAETSLAALGEAGIAAVGPALDGGSERGAAAALRVVRAAGGKHAHALLLDEMRRHVHAMWWHLLAALRLAPEGEARGELLRAALADAARRERRLAFRALELIETPRVVRRVERELRSGGERSRGQALEVLSNLGDRDAARLLALALESGPFEERAEEAADEVSVPHDPLAIARHAVDSTLPWVRAAGRALDPSQRGVSPEEEAMQRLLALKQVDLFSNLSLEQLDALHQATREAEYVPGEVIFREGAPGKELFLLLEGSVDIVKDQGGRDELLLARLSAVDYFGEMAILVDEARSATAIATSHCRMLTLDGRSFKELILQIPEISFEIFRVLTARVRRAETRLSEP